MNIVLAEPEEIHGAAILLTDHRARHIVKVLGAKEGDCVRFGALGGLRGTGTVLSVHARHPFRVKLHLELHTPPAGRPEIDIVVALPRPIMFKRILSQAAALGVGSISIIHANRVEKSFWKAGALEAASCREHLIRGLEQAVDTRLPQVEFYRRFKPFIEDILPVRSIGYSHLLLAHPGSRSVLHEVITHGTGRVLLAVGPEGGWAEYEVKKFMSAGFRPFSMGERILKVDTAVTSLHGRIMAVKAAHGPI